MPPSPSSEVLEESQACPDANADLVEREPAELTAAASSRSRAPMQPGDVVDHPLELSDRRTRLRRPPRSPGTGPCIGRKPGRLPNGRRARSGTLAAAPPGLRPPSPPRGEGLFCERISGEELPHHPTLCTMSPRRRGSRGAAAAVEVTTGYPDRSSVRAIASIIRQTAGLNRSQARRQPPLAEAQSSVRNEHGSRARAASRALANRAPAQRAVK